MTYITEKAEMVWNAEPGIPVLDIAFGAIVTSFISCFLLANTNMNPFFCGVTSLLLTVLFRALIIINFGF